MLLTRRKDQFRAPKNCPAGETLIGGILFCGSEEGRRNWIRMLSQRHPSKFNSFTCFRDVNCEHALQFGFAEWAIGSVHVLN